MIEALGKDDACETAYRDSRDMTDLLLKSASSTWRSVCHRAQALMHFGLSLPSGQYDFKVTRIPSIGNAEVVANSNVSILPGINQSTLVLTNSPPSPDSPRITSMQLVYESGAPVLQITGSGFNHPEDMRVNFQRDVLGQTIFTAVPTGTETLLRVPLEPRMALGLSRVSVTNLYKDGAGKVVAERQSNTVVQPATAAYTLVSQAADGRVAALDGRRTILDADDNAIPNPGFNQLIGSISLQAGTPGKLAVTHDSTRAYVLLRGDAPGVAVIDLLSLRQIDVLPIFAYQEDGYVDSISLSPTAAPYDIVIDPSDRYAYISDERTRSVYVIDINPNSPTFNQRVNVLSVGSGPGGLRGLDITSDGAMLYVAAPGRASFFEEGNTTKGFVHVFDIAFNDPKKWTQVRQIQAGMYPYDVTATADPDVVLVTNFLSDVNGVQVIRGGQVTDVQLVLGKLAGGGYLADTFDVSNAREIVITPDGRYAFVIGYTLPSAVDVARRHGYGQLGSAYKAGSNIGIIENPLTAPKLIAATRPLPFGFMTDLQISEDGHTLSVTLPNIQIDTGGTGACSNTMSMPSLPRSTMTGTSRLVCPPISAVGKCRS